MIKLKSYYLIVVVLLLSSSVIFCQEQHKDCNPLLDIKKIPNTEIIYYPIYGKTAKELNLEMNFKGPYDQFGKQRDAYTKWRISWRWETKNGMPDFNTTTAMYKIAVILPKWVNKEHAPLYLQKKWEEFICKVVFHELGHINNVVKHYQEITNNIRVFYKKYNKNLNIEKANAIAYKIIKKIRNLDLQYDKETQHGALQGISLK